MGVRYILSQVGNKMGLNPSDAAQRAVMLRFLNEAANELYDQSDMVGSLYEDLFKINGDQTVAFPLYVGQIRAARPYDTQFPWHINQMRPRYNVVNWPDKWRNFRIKNHQATHTTVRNESQMTVNVAAVETPNVVVMLSGSNDNAEYVSEEIVMDAVSKVSTNNYNVVKAFIKDRSNNYNLTLTDVDGLEMSILPNNQLEASFLIIDCSIFPYMNNDGGSPQAHWLEVLYKKRLSYLSNDGDEFPCQGFDNILVNKCLQLWMEEQQNPDLALVYDGKATRSLARKNEEENRATEDCVSLIPNPHDSLYAKVRPNRPRWFPSIRTAP